MYKTVSTTAIFKLAFYIAIKSGCYLPTLISAAAVYQSKKTSISIISGYHSDCLGYRNEGVASDWSCTDKTKGLSITAQVAFKFQLSTAKLITTEYLQLEMTWWFKRWGERVSEWERETLREWVCVREKARDGRDWSDLIIFPPSSAAE